MKNPTFLFRTFLSTFFVVALLLSGCGKKKEENLKLESKDVAQAESSELMAMIDDENIPVYEEEIDDLADSIDEFAVVENDEFSDLSDSIETTSPEKLYSENSDDIVKDSVQVAVSDEADDIFDNDLDDVNWVDEELLALEDDVNSSDSYKFKNIQFTLNKYGLRSDQKDVLRENIEVAKNAVENGKTISVIGHGCQLGDGAFNMPLSEDRAKTVKNVMIKHGIPANKIKVIGMGQEKPIVWSSQTDKAKLIEELAPNRRVEFLIS